MSRYSNQRQPKTPPHAGLRAVRKASGLTLDQVAEAVTTVLGLPPENRINRGTISAIESGLRGASVQMLDALAVAYGMEPGDLVTDYRPRGAGDLPEAAGL